MLELEQLKLELHGLAEPLKDLGKALYIEPTLDRISELEARTQEPDFWNDQTKAQEVQTKLAGLQRKVDTYRHLQKEFDDIDTLIDLGQEENDGAVVAEVQTQFNAFKELFNKLRLQTLLVGEYDRNNAILNIHAGAGGTEAQDWTEMLYRMYTRWAEDHDYQLKVLDILDGDEAGLKSVSFEIIGENAYGYMRSEMGVHRLVRISPFDASGRRHTSFASVEVLPELDNSIQININPDDLRIDRYRSSGAGGQHVNKTESAIRITHIPTGVVVSCQTERSQIQNRETAMNMLKSKLFALAKAAQMDKVDDLKGNQMDIAWGSQIRSYVFCPYTMVKDHRTNYEVTGVDKVMDGDLDGFINAYLSQGKQDK